MAAVTGFLSSGLRSRERLLQRRDREASLLLAAAERLSELSSITEAAAAAAALVERYTASPALVYVVGDTSKAEAFLVHGVESLEEADKKAARSCVAKGEACGLGTGCSQESAYRFIPARAGTSAVAAIGFSGSGTRANALSGEDELFAALGRSLALFIERGRSEEASRRAAARTRIREAREGSFRFRVARAQDATYDDHRIFERASG